MKTDELSFQLQEWVGRGMIAPEQAANILAFEAARHPADPAGGTQAEASPPPVGLEADPPGGLSRAALAGEVLGYVGGAVSFAALFAILTQPWGASLGILTRIALCGLMTAACLPGGWVLAAASARRTKRLGRYLLFWGVCGAGILGGLIAEAFLGGYHAPFVTGSAAAFVVGVAVWRRHRTALQLLLPALALVLLIPTASDAWLGDAADVWTVVLYLGAGGLLVLTAEFNWVQPAATAWSIGFFPLLLIIQIVAYQAGYARAAFLLLGCGLAALLLSVGAWRDRGAALGFGAAALVIFVPQFIAAVSKGRIALPVALALAGILLPAVSAPLIVGRLRRKPTP